MCTHNGIKYVEKQLESIFTQTRSPREIVISDDNSTDGTVEIIEKFLQKVRSTGGGNCPIEVTFLKNPKALGVTKNFEQAISECSHKLVALCDQDDIWEPSKLDNLVSEFEEDSQLFLVNSNATLVDECNKPLGLDLFQTLRVSPREIQLFNSGNSLAVLVKRNIVTGATMMFDRDLFILSRPFPAEFVHDEWLALVAGITGKKTKVLRTRLISYRQHSDNVIGVKRAGFRHFVGRTIFPRADRNIILLKRAKALLSFTVGCRSATNSAVELIREKYVFEAARSALPINRFFRIRPVLFQARLGRYSKFGIGFPDILRDLLQPE